MVNPTVVTQIGQIWVLLNIKAKPNPNIPKLTRTRVRQDREIVPMIFNCIRESSPYKDHF